MVWTFFFLSTFHAHMWISAKPHYWTCWQKKKNWNCKHRFVLHLQVLTFFFLSAFHSFLKFSVAFFSATKRVAVNFLGEELGNAMVDGFILKDIVSKHFAGEQLFGLRKCWIPFGKKGRHLKPWCLLCFYLHLSVHNTKLFAIEQRHSGTGAGRLVDLDSFKNARALKNLQN